MPFNCSMSQEVDKSDHKIWHTQNGTYKKFQMGQATGYRRRNSAPPPPLSGNQTQPKPTPAYSEENPIVFSVAYSQERRFRIAATDTYRNGVFTHSCTTQTCHEVVFYKQKCPYFGSCIWGPLFQWKVRMAFFCKTEPTWVRCMHWSVLLCNVFVFMTVALMLLALNLYRQWKLEHLCHKSGELITEAGYMDKVQTFPQISPITIQYEIVIIF